MIQPRIQFLERRTIERVIDEAYQLLSDPGVIFDTDRPLRLLADAGAEVDFGKRLARIPARLIDEARKTVPSEIVLYDLAGDPGELFNVAQAHPDTRDSLTAALLHWMEQSHAINRALPTETGNRATVDGALRQQLQAMGYLQ